MPSPRSIQLLSDDVINKIAAGEVVDRPASVLKELVENSIDAGSRNIAIALVDGGRKLISVSDDGCGMTRDDALLCIERHATSKLRSADDLERVATLGFRGEALAAIAAVSRFTIATRPADANDATEITISGGKILEVRETGAPPGTTMAARNLFFNVPARRRFLRSDQTELAHLRQVFLLHALAHPALGFRLVVDEREIYRLTPGASLEDRLRELLGSPVVRALRAVDATHEGVRVRGFASLPHTTRGDRSEQYVFVNSRPATAPVVGFAIAEAYQSLLPRGRHPLAVLFLEMDPSLVDVNVHPTKKEVRFRHPPAIRDAIIGGIRKALAIAPAHGSQMPSGLPKMKDLFVPAGRPATVSRSSDLPGLPAFPYPRVQPGGGPPAQNTNAGVPAAPQQQIENSGRDDSESHRSPWLWCRVLGQVGGTFVILETEDGMVLMDPQAAHERVIFERYLGEAARGAIHSQGLLAPESVSLPPEQARVIRKFLAAIQEMGFGIGEFGGDSFVIDALPACLGNKISAAQLLSDLAGQIEKGTPRGSSASWIREQVAQAACHAAVRARDALKPGEIEALVRDLARCEMPYTCPHGRPTVIFMGFQELKKKFGRA